ncbi:MAG: heme o synthase [Pseudomonadota bacterium]
MGVASSSAAAEIYNVGEVGDYFDLLKPRVMSLAIFTAFVGLMAAPGDMNPVLGFASLLAIAAGAGAAGALNMWYDADIDAVMARTSGRPIPSGRVPRAEALALGVGLSALSIVTLALAANYTAAALLAFAIFFYMGVYTLWLKRTTPQNIVIGGAAGALPPVIGWAAATGEVSAASVWMFLIIFLWTPPHFWALALYKSGDYDRAGIPMLPLVKGDRAARRYIFAYAVVLAAASIAPFALGVFGLTYGGIALAGGLVFASLAFRVLRDGAAQAESGASGAPERSLYLAPAAKRSARDLFAFSILYLFLIHVAILADYGVGRLF